MDELSRVKKYQELRNEVENDPEKELVSPALSSYAERLNKVHPHLSKVQAKQGQSGYEAIHKKRLDSFDSMEETDNLAHDFNDDYMSEFLSEVKAYNIEKGYRKNEDTSKDILRPLKSEDDLLKELAKKQVEDVSNVTENAVQESLDITLEEDQDAIRKLIENDFEDIDLEDDINQTQSNTDIQQVVEETQKLKLQISEYEKGLIDMNNSVLSSNRLINFLIFVLVLVLMIMLGIAIYWVLNNAN